MRRPIAHVYVDGFNLFKRSLSGRPELKWLDLVALAEMALPEFEIGKVYYFSARLKPKATFDLTAPQRQQIYLRALETQSPKVHVIFGQFQAISKLMVALPKEDAIDGSSWRKTKVLKTEEKGTDVNLASRLVADLLLGNCEIGVVMSNDSDQVGPIKMLTDEFGKRVGLIFPLEPGQKGNRELRKTNVEFARRITSTQLLACQLPAQIADANGIISRPEAWSQRLNTEGPENGAF